MNQEKEQPKEKLEPIRIVITLNQIDGRMSIAGPTHNKLLCAHMIADALKCIMDMQPALIKLPAGRA